MDLKALKAAGLGDRSARLFPRLKSLCLRLGGGEDLLEQFLTPTVTNLTLRIPDRNLGQPPIDLDILVPLLTSLGPRMPVMKGLTIASNGRTDNEHADISWWWSFIDLIPNTSQLTSFGVRHCAIPDRILQLVPSLPHLLTLHLDARTITPTASTEDTHPPAEPVLEPAGASLERTLAQMASHRLATLWLRTGSTPFNTEVLLRFTALEDLNLRTDSSMLKDALANLASLSQLRHIAVVSNRLEKTLDASLLKELLQGWTSVTSIVLLDPENTPYSIHRDAPQLHLRDLAVLGTQSPRLTHLRIVVDSHVHQDEAPPQTQLPKGMILDLSRTLVPFRQGSQVTTYLKDLGLQTSLLRSDQNGTGWSRIFRCFTPPKKPYPEEARLML